MSSWFRALRFSAAWQTGRTDVHHREVEIPVEEGVVPGSVYRPRGAGDPLPVWIVLHGLTRPGRAHPELVRFAGALASTPAVVLIPEVPEWRRLELAPDRTLPTIQGCLRFLEGDPDSPAADPGRPVADPDSPAGGLGHPVGDPGRSRGLPVVAGFSFGAPQALVAAAHPSLLGRLGGVLAWGGYHDIPRTLYFQMTGRYEGTDLAGRPLSGRIEPDAYGRWVVAANTLTLAPEYADATDVCRALHRLAWEVGDRQMPSDSPGTAHRISVLRWSVAPSRRDLYDLFAPPPGTVVDPEAAREAVDRLAEPTRTAIPLLDPRPHLAPLSVPVRILHARSDRLIPFTETVELSRAVAGTADLETELVGLLGHSGRPAATSPLAAVREVAEFLAALRKVVALGTVAPETQG